MTVLHGLVVLLVVMYVLVRLREGSSPLIPIKYEKVLATRLHGQPKCSLWRLGNT
jgi:hypothetical protein